MFARTNRKGPGQNRKLAKAVTETVPRDIISVRRCRVLFGRFAWSLRVRRRRRRPTRQSQSRRQSRLLSLWLGPISPCGCSACHSCIFAPTPYHAHTSNQIENAYWHSPCPDIGAALAIRIGKTQPERYPRRPTRGLRANNLSELRGNLSFYGVLDC